MVLTTKNKKSYDWTKEIGLDWSSILCDLASLDYSNDFLFFEINHFFKGADIVLVVKNG